MQNAAIYGTAIQRTILWTVCRVYSLQLQFVFFLCSYIAILIFTIAPSSSSPADWPCILLCVIIMGKSSHISGRDRFLQTIVSQRNVHFYKCGFRYAYLHTDVYALISAVHKKIWNSHLETHQGNYPFKQKATRLN